MLKKLLPILVTVFMLMSCVLPTVALANQLSTGPVSVTGGNAAAGNTYAHVSLPKMVAKPDINPAFGVYHSPQTVIISCKTEGATIHYTTNGRNPDKGAFRQGLRIS